MFQFPVAAVLTPNKIHWVYNCNQVSFSAGLSVAATLSAQGKLPGMLI